MADTTTEAIKEKLDIVEFVRGYVALTPAGRNFKGLCPFHKEKSPSFMVSPDRRSWHCFGCGEGGDVFSFLMKRENIEFGEALRILAEKAGVELRRVNPAEHKFTGLLFELNAVATEWFRAKYDEWPGAREYLEQRKLAKETITTFEIGWAPNDPEGLVMHLLKKGYDPQDIIRSGLAFQTDRGRVMDRFRGRIMFPIHNHFGKVVGFTGRILPQFDTGEMGKYVNSPETPIFQKSKLLYGYWKTKQDIRDAGKAFLVEGQMDFLMSYQAGVTIAVASSGTALTEDHLRTLRRGAEELFITFDNDPAGAAAAERAIDLAESNDFAVRVVVIPEPHKDPADAVVADPEILKAALAASVPAPEFYFKKHLPPGPLNQRDREQLKNLRLVLSKLVRIGSPVERDYWMKELGKRTAIDEATLREEAERVRSATLGEAPRAASPAPVSGPVPPVPKTPDRREALAGQLVAAAYARGDFAILAGAEEYLPLAYRTIAELLARGERGAREAEIDELLNSVMLRSEDPGDAEIEMIKRYLFEEHVHMRRRDLIQRVRRAEMAGDETAHRAALEELAKLPAF